MRNELPETCFATLPGMGDLIILKRGETGYYRSDWNTADKSENRELADFLNRKSGITPAQVEAMQVGSMCGFHVPGADPQTYFDEAKYIRSYELDLNGSLKDPITATCCPVVGKFHQYQVAQGTICYMEASNIPKDMMGPEGGFTFMLDMVHGKPLVPVTATWESGGVCRLELDHGSYTPGQEINAGHQIFAKVRVGPVEYALGGHGGQFPSFVTWERTPANDGGGPPNYYWGHYFENRMDAMIDFCSRASEKYEMLSENRKPSIKAQLAVKPVPGDQPAQKAKDLEVR